MSSGLVCTPDIIDVPVSSGDHLILSCDGFYEKLSKQDIGERASEILLKKQSDMEDICKELVSASIEAGSGDNHSIIIISIP